jgi:hypothetical protein
MRVLGKRYKTPVTPDAQCVSYCVNATPNDASEAFPKLRESMSFRHRYPLQRRTWITDANRNLHSEPE